jgi:hypothetical protein
MGQPQCLALIVCDLVIEDQRSGNKSLIGLFNTITAPAVPAGKRLFVFLSIGGMDQLVPFTLRLMGPMGQVAEMNMQPGPDKRAEPGAVHDIVIEIPGLQLPQAGAYSFELWQESTLMARRGFNLVIQNPAAKAPIAQG